MPTRNRASEISALAGLALAEAGVEHEYVELPGISHGPAITASQPYVYEYFGKHSK